MDLDAKRITITGSTAVIKGERINGTTKSGRTRVVTIDDETANVLRQRHKDQAAEQLHAGDSWRGTKDGYVFATGWGEPIYPDTVTSLMSKLIRAHNEPENGPPPKDQLPRARLHDLRHIHATTQFCCGRGPEGCPAGAGARHRCDDDGPLRPPGGRQPVAGRPARRGHHGGI
jgi:integrase